MSEERVFHPQFGWGLIKRTRHGGFNLEVTFEDGITRWVRLDEVKEGGDHPTESRIPSSEPRVFLNDERLKSRRMIEAFRLGIVPYDCVDEFTFGREKEYRQVKNWLKSLKDNILFVIGDYGTGKTHLLHYARGLALKEKFAVAWVEMDPNETPFHKPKRIYKSIVKSLRYRAQRDGVLHGFREFIEEVLFAGYFDDHIYFKYLKGKTDNENIWRWIEAQEPANIRPFTEDYPYLSIPGLYDYSNAANIYCYLLSSLGWAAKNALGLRGLLLIFDEAETIDMNYSTHQRLQSYNFMEALYQTSLNKAELLDKPYGSGLNYCIRGMAQQVPFLYKSSSYLKLIFAFTSIKFIPLKFIFSDPMIELAPLTDEVLRQVFEQICLLYKSSYDFSADSRITDAVFENINTKVECIRLFVKASVEAMDLIRFHSGDFLNQEF